MIYRVSVIIAAALLSYGAHAAEWRTKPVRCGSLQEVNSMLELLGEQYLLNGNGISYDSDLIPFAVQVGVWANLDTGTWSVIETDGTEACVLANGDRIRFDLLDKKSQT